MQPLALMSLSWVFDVYTWRSYHIAFCLTSWFLFCLSVYWHKNCLAKVLQIQLLCLWISKKNFDHVMKTYYNYYCIISLFPTIIKIKNSPVNETEINLNQTCSVFIVSNNSCVLIGCRQKVLQNLTHQGHPTIHA